MCQQYPQTAIDAAVPVQVGGFRVRANGRVIESEGSARLAMLPSPRIELVMETDSPRVLRDLDGIKVELPGFTMKKVVVHSAQWGSTDSGAIAIRASAGEMEQGGGEALQSVGFQVVNLPDFITLGPTGVLGNPAADPGSSEAPVPGETNQTVSLQQDDWRIRIVALPGSKPRYAQLGAVGGFAFTHVGQVTKAGGSSFSVDEAKEVLELLRVFLSFARGAACALPLQWGCGDSDEIVWRRLQSPVVDPWRRSHPGSWVGQGPQAGGILAALFDRFCHRLTDGAFRHHLYLALHWYRRCNTQSSGLEGSLVLGMAGLELLGELVCRAYNEEYDSGGSAARRLRQLLARMKVGTEIPPRYEAVAKFARANGNWDSCTALAKLRNGFVHAANAKNSFVFESEGREAVFHAWQLSLWYQELALLRLLGHDGDYHNRTTASWVGDVEPVPWRER